ncbi:MAG: hypothetical protein RL466_38 [Actinomycetota bacterium]|jgi:phosphoglycolate phosphatase
MAQDSIKDTVRFGFIFDLDGTLVDSTDQIARAVNRARMSWGFPVLDVEVIHQNVGLPADYMFSDLLLGKKEVLEIVVDFREYLLEDIKLANKVYDDALRFVQMIKGNRFFVAIATSKPTDLGVAVVENSKYIGLINQVVGIGPHKPKPDPGMILEIMNRNRLDGGVMFGDRPEDITAALNSGITAIGIAQTAFTSDDLIRVGARRAFSNFTKLMDDYEQTGDSLIDYFR